MRTELKALWPRLWRFAYGLCRDKSYAEDLAQSTCLRALENAHLFRKGTHLDRWAFTICRNLWLNELRSRKVRFGNGCVNVEADTKLAAIDHLETNILASEVFNHVMALPDAQRETVVLVYVEGFSYKEAAEILDCPIGTIMSRLSTARKMLAKLETKDAG